MITVVLSFSQFAVVLLLVVLLVQQTRSQRKTSRDPQRVKAHKPLPFLDFSPAATDFTCIWQDTTVGKRCGKKLNQQVMRLWANTLRNTIADDSPYSERARDMLWEYAEFCLCHHHRPRTKTSPVIIEDWVKQWLVEIRALHDSLCEELADDSSVGEGVLLYPLTTVPEPTSEDESRDLEDRSASNTPLKRETSDQFTPTKKVPGSFPDDDMFKYMDWRALADQPSTYERRSLTPETPSPRKYSQTIRNSPLGVERISFKRTSSATPRLGSTQTGKFEPYPNKLKRTLLSVLNTPLGKDERKSGHVYIFTRRSDEDTHSLYVKIGKAENVTDRFEEWKTKCSYEPQLEYKTARITNAMRVELLVHTELIQLRYIEQQCSGCGGKHDEWFKTDIDTARPVVERWAQWMQECGPYTQEGQLSSHVVKGIFEHKLSKAPLTGKKMLMLITNKATAEAARQTSPEGSHRRRTVASIEGFEPASPSVRKSTLTGTDPDSTAASDDEDSFEPIQSPSPSPDRVKVRTGTKGAGLNIKRTRKRPSSVKADPEQATSAINTERKEAKVKLEPIDDLHGPYASDIELSDSQEPYLDAETFPDRSPGIVPASNGLGISSIDQQQTTRGSSETVEMLTGVE
jgi:hypothetical protein